MSGNTNSFGDFPQNGRSPDDRVCVFTHAWDVNTGDFIDVTYPATRDNSDIAFGTGEADFAVRGDGRVMNIDGAVGAIGLGGLKMEEILDAQDQVEGFRVFEF